MNARFLSLLILVLALAQSVQGENRFAAPGQARPNFLLLLTDDQTFRTLSIVGELEVKTPNLDRLARRGTRFTH